MLLFLSYAVAEFHCHCNYFCELTSCKTRLSWRDSIWECFRGYLSTAWEKHRKRGPLVHSRMSVRKTQQASAAAPLHAPPVWLHGLETHFLQHTRTLQEVPHTFLIITPDAAPCTATMAGTETGGKDVFQRWGESIVPCFLQWHNRGSQDWDGTAEPGKQHP